MDRSISFGYWLRRRRKMLDLTQDALAHCVGCAVGTIKSIESDARRPSKQMAARLAQCLRLNEQEHAAFIKAARAERAVDHMPLAAPLNAFPQQSSIQKVTCPTCSATVPADRRLCGQCGTLMRQVCMACEAESPLGNLFCGACGATFESITQAAAIGTERIGTLPREERRWVTVLFADIAGFTAMSERMDPEDVKDLVAHCIEQMDVHIRQFGGTVVNVMGDALLAVFGAPHAHEDDAARAVRAAITMRDSNLVDNSAPPLKLHIGLNTGEVLATLHGPQEHRSYTVLGDVVNTAHRILEAAPSGSVFVGEETYRATRHAVQYSTLAPVIAKGKAQPMPVWEALTGTLLPEARPLGMAPLVGRDEELTLLQMLWERVIREGQPHLVTILGEPGIGKSRLAAEFAARLPSDVLVLRGRCLPYGTTLGYWALATMLKEASGISAEDAAEAARAKLRALVAGVVTPETGDPDEMTLHLALLTGMDTEADRTTPAGDQRALHASARRFLAAFARQRPLCLLFDDMHWADDALLDLIELWAARIVDAPVLIVTQARPELLEHRPTWARGVRSFTSLPLTPLTEPLERELVLTLCRERGLADDLAAQIGRGAGGNPLFAEEVVAMIADHGPVSGIPTLIKLLIAARLDTLPPAERNTLQCAAIFGKSFWEGGLQMLTAEATDNTRDHLEALEHKDLLRVQVRSQFRDDREYVFKHDLIRDVAYEMLPKGERRALHSRVVAWLEQREDTYFDLLAHHAVQSGQQQRAVGYLTEAAERASRAAAHRQAAAILGEALTIAGRIGQRDQIATLHAKRGGAFAQAGMWANAKPDLETALSDLASQQIEQRVRVLIDLADVRYWLLDIAGLRECATEALTLAEYAGRDELVAGALARLAVAESSDGNLAAALSRRDQAVARIGGIVPILGNGVAIGGLIAYWLGRADDAIRMNRDATQSYREWNDTALFVTTYGQWGIALAGAGRYAEAAQVFAEAIRLGREYEVWPFVARATAMSAGFHLDLFDFAGHEALAEEARELARATNFPPPAASAGIDLLLNFARRQDVERAEMLLPEIAAVVEKAGGFHGWLWRLRLAEARAEIALARGDWEDVIGYADSAIAQSHARGRLKYHILGLDTRAKALIRLDHALKATATLHEALTLARSLGDPAVFLRPATTLLSVADDAALLHETHSTIQRIAATMPNEELCRIFEAAEPVQRILALHS